MLMLVTADNLLQLFFGWEGVGLCSYLLIGYWYDRPAANAAAIKAFIVNRIGDLAFAVGVALVFLKFGSIEFSTIFPAIAQHQGDIYSVLGGTFPAFEVIGVLLFIGAMGKSAQIGLHVWLPDAMEGPTPVSALIHAATMVTAGVFLVARMSPLYEFAPFALGMVTFIGATTALFAATVGCAQNDIKRVIAYSTCSQLGYMFVAAGVGAFQVSIFHLITHAFFKALLFLSAGSVIHAMSDEQDMRKMGGLWKLIPWTCAVMWVGNLALAGIPPFAGYYSKDAIISAAYAVRHRHRHVRLRLHRARGLPHGVLFLAAADHDLLWQAACRSSRDGACARKPARDDRAAAGPGNRRSDRRQTVGSLVHRRGLAGILERQHLQRARPIMCLRVWSMCRLWAEMAPLVVGLLGIATAYVMYMAFPLLPMRLATQFRGIYQFLLNKWYFDELYDAIFVQPLIRLARVFWQTGDAMLIDGVPNGLAELTVDGSRQAVKIQTGSLAMYAFVMLIGVVVLIGLFLLSR